MSVKKNILRNQAAALCLAAIAPLAAASAARAQTSNWINAGSGSWNNPGNWDNGIPDGPTAAAVLGPSIQSPSTVNLDATQQVAALLFNNPGDAYTIATGAGGTLALQNTASGLGVVTDLGGNQFISAPVLMESSTLFDVANPSDTLAISGVITASAGAGLTKTGFGTLDLTANDTFSSAGTTAIDGGTLVLNYTTLGGSILGGNAPLYFGGGALQINGATSANTAGAESFPSTTFGGGVNAINVTQPAASSPVSVGLGTINRATSSQGAVVTFAGPVNGTMTPFQTPSNSTIPALLGATNDGNTYSGYATYGASDWAAVTASSNGTSYVAPGSAISGFYTPTYHSGSLFPYFFFASPPANLDVNGPNLGFAPPNNTELSIRFNTPNIGSINNEPSLGGVALNPTFNCAAWLVTPNLVYLAIIKRT